MFTVKFYREHNETSSDGIQMEAFSCARYNIAEGKRTLVYMYPTLKAENVVCMYLHVEEDQDTYYEAFIENQSGKTIDRYRAWT